MLDIGEIRVLGEIRLYQVLAALLTLVEAGVGFLYGRLGRESDGAPERTYLARVIVVCFSVALAFIEGLFYSRVGSESQRFLIPFVDVSFTMQQAFFLWGFVLPLMLFGLGHQWYRSIEQLAGGHIGTRLRRELKNAGDLSERLSRGLLSVETQLTRVREESTEAQAGSPLYSEAQAARLTETLKTSIAQVDAMRTSTPAWAANVVEPVPEAEQRQQAFRAGALFVVASSACVVSVWLQVRILPGLYGVVGPELAFGLGVANCAVLLGAGLLLRSRATIVDEEGAFRVIEGRGAIMKHVTAGGMVAFLLVTGLWVFWNEAMGRGFGFAWAVVLGIGIGLVPLGAELPSMLALAYCCIGAGIALAEGTCAVAAAWSLRFVLALLLLIEFVAGVLAVPAQWIAARRASNS